MAEFRVTYCGDYSVTSTSLYDIDEVCGYLPKVQIIAAAYRVCQGSEWQTMRFPMLSTDILTAAEALYRLMMRDANDVDLPDGIRDAALDFTFVLEDIMDPDGEELDEIGGDLEDQFSYLMDPDGFMDPAPDVLGADPMDPSLYIYTDEKDLSGLLEDEV